MSTPTPGRRSAARSNGRRVDVTTLLAVALPLFAVLAVLLVRPDDPPQADFPPEETELTQATLICPSGDDGVVVASDTDASGEAVVRQGKQEEVAQLSPGRATGVRTGEAPAVVATEGDLAPGLLAGRFGAPLVAPECRPPAFDEWFTGVGAGAKHSSVLELVNPDAGPAVVDAIAYGRRGPVDAPALRGVAVPGRSVVHIDLAERVPRRDDLALHVTTTRGRVSAAVVDTYDELGSAGSATDYLPSQPAPTTSNLLLGLPEGAGRRTLLLANPSESETRASIKVVTEDAVFTAVGTEDAVLAPQSVTRVSVSSLLRGRNADDALGLLVESTAPVTASARFYVDGDLAHAVPPEPVDETALLVPTGTKQLLVAGADRAGAVTVVSTDSDGEVVAEDRLEVDAGRGGVLDLPDEAVLITVSTNNTAIDGAVLATGDGAAVYRLRPLQRSGLIADVRPGLP
ncbi:MAG TPA: DUF5719 family protein [Nocardioides sp.]|nr:DUF5719 family protein [Nocardioides sp.]